MSLSSDEEDDDVGDTDRSNRDKEDEADSGEELIPKVDAKSHLITFQSRMWPVLSSPKRG